MAVTLADIADRVGVTQATVSMVLNKAPSSVRISERTRQKIFQVAEELNYTPSFVARSLVKGRTFTLGLLMGGIESAHHAEVTTLVLEEAEACGYRVLLAVTEWSHEKELECLDMLVHHRVDGILLGSHALRSGTRQYEYITSQHVPIVLLGYSEEFACAYSDWKPGMTQTLDFLTKKGYSRIGYLHSDTSGFTDFKQMDLKEVCQRFGLALKQYTCEPNQADCARCGRQFARTDQGPDVMIVQSDFMATGFMRGLYDQGLQVPRDLAVVGCDGTNAGEFFVPPITSIAQDCRVLIKGAVELLVEMIGNRNVPKRKVSVATRLIVRGSA